MGIEKFAKKPGKARRGRARILVWGASGTGKSYGLAGFPNAVYNDAENGALEPQYQSQMEAGNTLYIGIEDGALDHNNVISMVKELGKGKHEIKTVIIDSLSKLFDTQVANDYDRMLASGRDMEKSYGAEKKGAIGFVRRLIRWADMLDVNLILVCHAKDVWENGKVVGKTFDAWPKLEYDFHVALQIENRRAIVTKTRYEEFPKNSSFEWNYTEFANRYGRESLEAASAPPPLATSDQIASLNHMIEVIKLQPDQVNVWLDKAQAETFSEMTSDQIQKCIDWCCARVLKAEKAVA